MEKRNSIPVTVQLILEKEDKILLMKRKNTGYEDGKYGLPGGHVEKNEEIKIAMIRETKEEIGIDIKKDDLKLYKVVNIKINDETQYIYFIFNTCKWSGNIENCESDKCEEVKWINKDNIPENTIQFIKDLLKNNEDIYLPYGW